VNNEKTPKKYNKAERLQRSGNMQSGQVESREHESMQQDEPAWKVYQK
jgi:hypothetical protein